MPARTLSASEVARSRDKFQTWLAYHACVQVSFNDIPADYDKQVDQLFDFDRRILRDIVTKDSALRTETKKVSPKFVKFLDLARKERKQLFSSKPPADDDIFTDLNSVFVAWEKVKQMQNSDQQYSEADYVANVYNHIRNPAIRRNVMRSQLPIALPQPLTQASGAAAKALEPSAAIPDNAVFVRSPLLRKLGRHEKSAFVSLNSSKRMRRFSAKGNSFRKQATPTLKVPDPPCFEFASSIWEDKKPCDDSLDEAYRQNRMATTSLLRQLDCFGVAAPVIGLVWGNGRVRAHIDWAVRDPDDPEKLQIMSAPYPGEATSRRDSSSSQFRDFYEWDLTKPSHIIEVYLLVRNIDTWTENSFADAVIAGVKHFVERVEVGEVVFDPWKKEQVQFIPTKQKENSPATTRQTRSSTKKSTKTKISKGF